MRLVSLTQNFFCKYRIVKKHGLYIIILQVCGKKNTIISKKLTVVFQLFLISGSTCIRIFGNEQILRRGIKNCKMHAKHTKIALLPFLCQNRQSWFNFNTFCGNNGVKKYFWGKCFPCPSWHHHWSCSIWYQHTHTLWKTEEIVCMGECEFPSDQLTGSFHMKFLHPLKFICDVIKQNESELKKISITRCSPTMKMIFFLVTCWFCNSSTAHIFGSKWLHFHFA